MHRLLKSLLITLVILLPAGLSAADPGFTFRRYNMSSGLPSDMIGALLQDSNGLLWIGNGEGVCSFDGRVISSCQMFDGTREVGGLSVNCLAEDTEHTIWAGTDDGLYYHRDSDSGSSFMKLSVATPAGNVVNTTITSVAVDHDGLVWFSTRGQGVMCYDPDSRRLSAYPDEESAKDVESVFVDSSNTVWAAFSTDLNCVHAFNKAESAFRRVDVNLGPGIYSRLGLIQEDSSSNLWFASWDQGLYMYDRNTGSAIRFAAGGQGFYHVHSMTELRPGEFLIGSDDGLLWYNVISSETRLYGNDRGEVTSLSNKFVYPIMKDREGGLWVGTFYGGINYVNPNTAQFKQVARVRGMNSSEDFVVSSFAQDPDGSIWTGSDNFGLVHCLDNGECVSIPASKSWNVHSIWADPGYVWIGTYGQGLMRIDKRSGAIKNYGQSNGLDDSSVYAMKRDSRGRLWVATISGFFVYSEFSDSFEKKYTSGSLCYDIEESRNGDLWFSTISGGVVRLCGSDGSWRRYGLGDGNMISDVVYSLYASMDGSVYAATADGLACFNESQDMFTLQGLNRYGSLMHVCGDGENLWITAPDRLLKYNLSDGSVTTYDSGDGMIDGQFIANAGLVATSGKIYLGTTKGFSYFIPQNIVSNEYVPPVLITSLEFRDRKRSASMGGDGYRAVDIKQDVNLNWHRNDVRLSFVGLSYCSPHKNRYAYMLEGFDSQWSEAADMSMATYTNLPAGKYRFMVKASNNDGVWNDEGASLEFRIRPHAMKTFVAKVCYIFILLMGAMALYHYFKTRSEQRLRAGFEEKERQREADELESKINFLTSIAHEVRTPLSLIIAPVERLRASSSDMSEQDRGYLDVIDRNCGRLGRLINQLLDFSRFNSEIRENFCFSNSDAGLLIRSVTSTFIPTFEKEGIHFSEEYPETPLMVDMDAEALTTIVMNLLSNATKYTSDRVSLTCSRMDMSYVITVADNGPGISEELRGRIFHPFFRADESSVGTGLGLAIVKKLVDAQGGNISVEDAQGSGSMFIVSLPVIQPDSRKGSSSKVESDALDAANPNEETIQRLKVGNNDKPTILIVEDDVDMRSFLVSDFKGLYNVLEAPDSETAERLLFQYDISLVISDWMMPGKSGADLCRFVRSRKILCKLPFIMLTAKSDDASQLESMDCGADAHVKKPFSPEHLRALVAHQIRMRDMLAQRYSSAKSIDMAPGNNPEVDFFSRITEIIEANISNTELSVEMLAKELCVSRSGLFAKVKAASGDTPNRLIMDIRLKAAAKLLKETGHSVSEISYMVGFNSLSYFSKCFSGQYGMTPHQWIEKYRIGNIK